MSDALTEHHALTAFLAATDTPTSGEASTVIDVRPDRQYLNLRGSEGDSAFSAAVESVIGEALPFEPNTVAGSDKRICWLGPNEWLVITEGMAGNDYEDLAGNLSGLQASIVDVSEGYISLSMYGKPTYDVLAKGCALDLRHFAHGQCAQSIIARAGVLLVAGTDRENIEIIVRRSFAEYLALWLRNAAAEYGVRFDLTN
jgi:sarcosine oxidase subunit gamma